MNDNLIQFLLEKKLDLSILCGFYSCYFSEFILKLLVFSEKILNLNNLLVAANLNRK